MRSIHQKTTLHKLGKNFPHRSNELTKATVTTKLKVIKIKFRATVENGR